MGMQSKISQTSTITNTMIEIGILLARAQDDLSAFDISMWFQEYDGPPEGAELILSQDLAQYHIRSADDEDPCYPALAGILRLYATDPAPWESIVRRLIRYGADVHAPVRRDLTDLDQSEYDCPLKPYGTPLDELFLYTHDPLEGQAAANSWLQLLASEGHDIPKYLETESVLHIDSMQLTHPSYRPVGYDNERKLVFDLEARPSVFWDWWINPNSSTFFLREEFRLMAITMPDGFLIAQSWKEAWPIRYPAWDKLHQSYGIGDAQSSSRHKEFRKKLLELANARTAKRLAKKARKKARAEKYKGPRKIPGAWPI